MWSPHFQFLLLLLCLAAATLAFQRRRPREFMKTVRWLDQRSGAAIIVLGVMVIVCGCLGFADGSDLTLAGAIYETLQIFTLNVEPSALEANYLLSMAMVSATLLVVIVAGKGIALLFHESYESLGLRFKSKHVVVCGLGRIGRQVLADLESMKAEYPLVVLEPDANNKNIEWAREMGAVVIVGDATRSEMLEAARVYRAREVFVVTGSDECNIEAVIEINDILQRRPRKGLFGESLPKLRCHVHILNKDLAEIIREKTIRLEQSSNNPHAQHIDIEVFNALERTARRLLEDIAISMRLENSARPSITGGVPTERKATEAIASQAATIKPTIESPIKPTVEPTTQSSDTSEASMVPHYFLFGFGDFGQTLALKLAELSHFSSCKRTRMSIIDEKIQQKAATFLARHPAFAPALDPTKSWAFSKDADQWESKAFRPVEHCRLPDGSPGIEYVCNARFVEYVDVGDDDLLDKLLKCCTDGHIRPIILVCFEADRENFARAERLRAKLNSRGVNLPVFVWIPRQRELSRLLVEQKQTRFASGSQCELIPFGQCYGSVSYLEINDSWMDWLARLLQVVNLNPSSPSWNSQAALLREVISSRSSSTDTSSVDASSVDALYGDRNGIDWVEMDRAARMIWDACSEWMRASNRSCAVHAVLKVAELGYRIVGYTNTPSRPASLQLSETLCRRLLEMEHCRWVSERLLSGWRYDVQRSSVRRTRWQITPWSKLDQPPAQAIEEAKHSGMTINEKVKDEYVVGLVIELIRAGCLMVEPIQELRKA